MKPKRRVRINRDKWDNLSRAIGWLVNSVDDDTPPHIVNAIMCVHCEAMRLHGTSQEFIDETTNRYGEILRKSLTGEAILKK